MIITWLSAAAGHFLPRPPPAGICKGVRLCRGLSLLQRAASFAPPDVVCGLITSRTAAATLPCCRACSTRFARRRGGPGGRARGTGVTELRIDCLYPLSHGAYEANMMTVYALSQCVWGLDRSCIMTIVCATAEGKRCCQTESVLKPQVRCHGASMKHTYYFVTRVFLHIATMT